MFRCIFSVRLPSFQCLYCGLPCPPTVFTLSPYPYSFPLHTWASQVFNFHLILNSLLSSHSIFLPMDHRTVPLSLSISSLHFHSLYKPIFLLVLFPATKPNKVFLLSGSIYTMMAVAIERYITVCHPFFKITHNWGAYK